MILLYISIKKSAENTLFNSPILNKTYSFNCFRDHIGFKIKTLNFRLAICLPGTSIFGVVLSLFCIVFHGRDSWNFEAIGKFQVCKRGDTF